MYLARAILISLGLLAVGLVGYQIGVSQAIATELPATVPAAYWYGPHWFGFGLFGFLFPLLFIFLLFGLVRAAFGGGRGWHSERRHWGRLEEIHRELHGEKPTSGASGQPT